MTEEIKESPIRLLIVDDHAIVREGMNFLALTKSDIEIVGEAEDGVQAVEMAAKLKPDVILLDLMMPRMDGITAAEAICTGNPEARILIMTSFAEGIPVVLMEAMACGVPVVAPRITGIPELVTDGVNGCLTAPGNVPELVRSVQNLFDDPELRNAFAAQGRQTVENEFNIGIQSSRLATLFQQRL